MFIDVLLMLWDSQPQTCPALHPLCSGLCLGLRTEKGRRTSVTRVRKGLSAGKTMGRFQASTSHLRVRTNWGSSPVLRVL